MNTSMIKLTLGLAIACVSATALGAELEADTSYMTIARLEGSSSADQGFRVYPDGYSLPSVGCAKNDFAEVKFTKNSLEVMTINRTLMGAFTAGRKVQFHLKGCGVTGRPAYTSVSIDITQ